MASALRSQIASTVATGVTAPAAPRPQWLRRGRIDLVFIADIVTALILFAITNNVIGNQNAAQGHRYGPGVLLLIALVLCAPLLLRTRLPLTALTASAATILWTSAALPPHSLTTAPYVPTTVIIYGLCMYSVAVRCKAWVVSTAVVVTVLAAAVIDAIIVLKFFFGPSSGLLFAIKNQNLSPSMFATGPSSALTNSLATSVLPAPMGPDSKMIELIIPFFRGVGKQSLAPNGCGESPTSHAASFILVSAHYANYENQSFYYSSAIIERF